MPTYDYICTACKHTWEQEQRIVEDPIRKCPKCGANNAKRQISSGAGFILKGGGWYADGYGSKKSSSDAKPDDKGSTSDAKSASKVESSGTDAKASSTPAGSETKAEKKPEGKVGSGGETVKPTKPKAD